MKKLIIAAALLGMATPTLAEDRVFDFMGFDTETAVERPEINGKECELDDGKRSCTLWDTRLGDAKAEIIMVYFYEGKLSSMLGIADRNQFLSLLSAFTAKYGSPKMETRKWQNRAGATLDNSVATWTFKDGELELAEIGSRIDNTDFQFFSKANQPEAEAPEVNF